MPTQSMDFTSVTLGSGFDWLTKSVGLKLAQPITDDATNNITKSIPFPLPRTLPVMFAGKLILLFMAASPTRSSKSYRSFKRMRSDFTNSNARNNTCLTPDTGVEPPQAKLWWTLTYKGISNDCYAAKAVTAADQSGI